MSSKQIVEIQKLKDEITALKKSDELNFQQHKEILDMLRPISETYCTVGKMGKWVMAILVFISILLGIVLTWLKIIK